MLVEIQPPAEGEALRLLAVHAHPDDESSKGAGTMARYAAEGVEVTVITCTGGERGDILNPNLVDKPDILDNLPEVRRQEMARAQEILGINHEWLGFVDSGLPEGDPLPPLPEGCFALVDVETASRPLVEAVRRLRPHVMITYDENGGYPHPDHIQTHRISMRAFDDAANPELYPELGEPWAISKVYFANVFSRPKLVALSRQLRRQHRHDSTLEAFLQNFDETQDRLLTTRVNVADYLDVRDEALRAHETQVDPDGFFFLMDNETLRSTWPTEDFELHQSRIGVTLPESDLFAGIRHGEAWS